MVAAQTNTPVIDPEQAQPGVMPEAEVQAAINDTYLPTDPSLDEVTELPYNLDGSTPPEQAITTEKDPSSYPEVRRMDRLFVGALGTVALIGDVVMDKVENRFEKIAFQFSELKNSFRQKMSQHFQNSYETRVMNKRGGAVNKLQDYAISARKSGLDDVFETEKAQIKEVVNSVPASRLQRWANRLGLSAQESVMQEIAGQNMVTGLDEVPSYPEVAAEAKEKGNWTEYQKALLHLADETEKRRERGEDTTVIDSYIEKLDARLEAVNTPDQKIERQQIKTEVASSTADWLQADRLLEMKDQIERELAKAVDEATLLGNQQQVGFDKEKTRNEITNRVLGSYFDSVVRSHNRAETAPQEVRNSIRALMRLPMDELAEELASK